LATYYNDILSSPQLYYVESPKTPRWFDPHGIIIMQSVPEMISYKALKTTKYVGAIVSCPAKYQSVSVSPL
jgi:hypothetical protein